VINDPKGTKQEGILMFFKGVTDGRELTMFVDKRDMARLAKFTQTGREYWKRFRLPKMKEQTAEPDMIKLC